MLLLIITSLFVVSLFSLIGILFLILKKEILHKILNILVSFSAGTLLGVAFLDLIPEAIKKTKTDGVFLFIIAGIVLFFVLEKTIFWHHCKEGECDIHIYTYLSLIGDGVHNFIDGIIIATAYIASIPLGITTTIAVIFHEIPQEIGDFGILIHGGFSRIKALCYNFLSAITAILGGILTFFFSTQIQQAVPVLLAFAAGGFIYVSNSDLIPQLHKEKHRSKMILQLIFFIFGIALIWLLKIIFGH
jgi:zinc and cadmium transporter